MKYTADEQYMIQYKEIKKKHRKRKAIIVSISLIIAIITLTLAYLGFKKIIDIGDSFIYLAVIGTGALALAVKLPFNQSDTEYNEIKSLNNAYTQERFKDRNG